MIKAERHDKILSELAIRGAVSVHDLATLLLVSEATVRRDLTELDDKALVERTHGGVTLPSHDDELPYQFKVTAYLAEKRRIGAMAASLLQANQVIGCSGGTTVAQVMRAVRSKAVRIVTNAVSVAMELSGAPDIEVLVTGGSLRSRTYELVGHVAERTLREVHLDIALIGVDGLSFEQGITTYNFAEANVNRELIGRAREVWVVADHSKIGQIKPAVVAPLETVDRLIVDDAISAETTTRLRAAGIDVVIA